MFEYVALAGLSDMDKVSVLAALVVFRLCYLIIPLIIAMIVVIVFERGQFSLSPRARRCRNRRRRSERASAVLGSSASRMSPMRLGKLCGLDYLGAGARRQAARAGSPAAQHCGAIGAACWGIG